MKRTISLPSFGGVAEGSVATLNLPIGWNYHRLILNRGGTTFNHDHMIRITLLANGVPIQEFSGAQLDDMQEFDGVANGNNTTGLSVIEFERPGLELPVAREATAINSRLMTTLQLEVEISGSTAPTLSAKAVVSTGRLADDRIIKRRRHNRTATGAGTLEISDIPFGDDLINRIFILHEGDVDAVTVKRDNAIIFERTEAENNLIQSNGVKTTVTNCFVIDPSELGAGDQAIVTAGVSDFKLELTMGGADAVVVIPEYLGLPGQGQ